MARIGSVFVIYMLLSSHLLYAGSLIGELDKTQGSIYDQFIYTLTAEGSDIEGEPEFPDVQGLELGHVGRGDSFNIVLGQKAQRTKQWSYHLSIQKPGVYEIPAISLEIDGQMLKTLPLKLKVTEATPELGKDAPLMIERLVEKSSVYVGEPILVTLRILTRQKMFSTNLNAVLPDAFQEIELDKRRSYSKVINGHQYDVIELFSLVIPQKSGSFQLDPPILKAAVAAKQQPRQRSPFGLFQQVAKVEKTAVGETVTIAVQELPRAGRPANFSGAVGQFRLKASLSQSQVNAGDTTTLTLEVIGRGMGRGQAPPQLDLPDSFKVYQDKPSYEEEITVQNGMISRSIYKYALVPEQPGTFNLPEVSFWIFDPQKAGYEKLTATVAALEVGGSAMSPAVSAAEAVKQEVKQLDQDIMDIDRTPLKSSGFLAKSWLAWLCVALSVGCFLGVWCYQYLSQNQEQRQKRRLAKKAAKNFYQSCISLSQQQDQAGLAGGLDAALRGYLQDRLNASAAALTSEDVYHYFANRPECQDLAQHGRTLFHQIEELRYGAPKAQLVGQELVAGAKAWVKEVEKKCDV